MTLVLAAASLMAAILFAFRNSNIVVAGFGIRQILGIDLILFFAGMVSGLSGFGFSAVGAACLVLIPPVLGVPLLQALSTGNQILSVGQLREDMPRSVQGFCLGPGPCILGGMAGVPLGVWLLNRLPAYQLTLILGSMLVMFAAYSIVKPAGARISRFTGQAAGAGVGFLGGIIGGFTAFPGAAVVVWAGLQDLPKEQNRAIVQPYILVLQIFALATNAWSHPVVFGKQFWTLLAFTLPLVLPGTLGGVLLYRRISDVNFRRVSFYLLGFSGLVLLLKAIQ